MADQGKMAFIEMYQVLASFINLVDERERLKNDDEMWALFTYAVKAISMANEVMEADMAKAHGRPN